MMSFLLPVHCLNPLFPKILDGFAITPMLICLFVRVIMHHTLVAPSCRPYNDKMQAVRKIYLRAFHVSGSASSSSSVSCGLSMSNTEYRSPSENSTQIALLPLFALTSIRTGSMSSAGNVCLIKLYALPVQSRSILAIGSSGMQRSSGISSPVFNKISRPASMSWLSGKGMLTRRNKGDGPGRQT